MAHKIGIDTEYFNFIINYMMMMIKYIMKVIFVREKYCF